MFHFSVELDKPKGTISQAKDRPNLRARHFFHRGLKENKLFRLNFSMDLTVEMPEKT